jgi:hypothetical protein
LKGQDRTIMASEDSDGRGTQACKFAFEEGARLSFDPPLSEGFSGQPAGGSGIDSAKAMAGFGRLKNKKFGGQFIQAPFLHCIENDQETIPHKKVVKREVV